MINQVIRCLNYCWESKFSPSISLLSLSLFSTKSFFLEPKSSVPIGYFCSFLLFPSVPLFVFALPLFSGKVDSFFHFSVAKSRRFLRYSSERSPIFFFFFPRKHGFLVKESKSLLLPNFHSFCHAFFLPSKSIKIRTLFL